VHEAHDLRLGGPVMAKLVRLPGTPSLDARAGWLARMQREGEIARQIAHPDVLRVLDGGMLDDQAWLITEAVQGHDLTRYTHRARLLPDALVLRLSARVAHALSHAHEQGVIHRDLKPANVLVDLVHDAVKVADFGVAHMAGTSLTCSGLLLGTPAYMAPELLAGAPPTPACDAWSLGVLTYELLSARRPHQASSLTELLLATTHQPAHPLQALRPDLPESICAHVTALLAADPARRPLPLADWALAAAGLASAIERATGNRHPANPVLTG
jgi:serine/threonine-protein kinase